MEYAITLTAALACGVFISTYTAYLLKPENYPELKEKQSTKRAQTVKSITVIVLNVAIWLLLLLTTGFSAGFLMYALTSTALLGLSVVDLAVYEIPPQFNWFILVMGALATALDRQNWLLHLIGMVLVSGIFYLIALLTKGKGMGGGDIKLMATVGLLLGWKQILLVMVLGSILGAVIHSIVMAASQKEHVLAFGPYLSAAAVIAMVCGDRILNWYIQTFLTFE